MLKKIGSTIPHSPTLIPNNTLHQDFKLIPNLHSLTAFCQPFASALFDLYEASPEMASQMLGAAVDTSRGSPQLHIAVFCHLIFLSFSVTHPLITCLIEHMQKLQLPFCAHCADEIEAYTCFLRELEPDRIPPTLANFATNKIHKEYFKDNEDISKMPKMQQLGVPNFTSFTYDPKVLQSTFTTKPTHSTSNPYRDQPIQASDLGKNFYCGSVAQLNRKSIFEPKVFPSPESSPFYLRTNRI